MCVAVVVQLLSETFFLLINIYRVTLSLLHPNVLLNTQFLNTFTLHFPLNLSEKVAHPHKTTGQIIVLYILIFILLNSKPEDKDFAPNDNKHSLTSVYS
jgi:hypothetical protein